MELCVHIAIFYKQTQIESKASETIVKNDKLVSSQRHQRNVIGAIGHFASFAASLALLVVDSGIPAYYFIKWNTSGGPPMICYFFIFLFPSINVFVFPFIETLCTENLRRDILEFICWKVG